MSRILFNRAPVGIDLVRGEIIRQLQSKLGLNGADLDGIYGGDTQTALKSWQIGNGLPNTGAVDLDTWARLMQRPIPPMLDRCLQITGAFEGHGFTKLEGNFDGAGLTWGIIGFTWHNGQLQGILRTIRTQAPGAYSDAFGNLAADLDEVLAKPKAAQMDWAVNHVTTPPGSAGVRQEWKAAFARLGEAPAVQAIELDAVRPAWNLANEYFERCGLKTELSLALCFDIAVQIGIKDAA